MKLDVGATTQNVTLVPLLQHANPDGDLVAIQSGEDVPFPIVRLFTVRAPTGGVRGKHAHIKCNQFLTCQNGSIEVECDNGSSVHRYQLDSAGIGLLVPPGHWLTVNFLSNAAVLLVVCDRPFEAEDYIRDYAEFKRFTASESSPS